MTIKLDYEIDFEDIKNLCHEAFDTLQVDLLSPGSVNYF